MGQDAPLSPRQALLRLRRGDVVLAGKAANQPLIVFRHGRWHMITVSWVTDARWRTKEGIAAVHFMSPRRARRTVAEWLPYSRLLPFEAVCPGFREEVCAKVLPDAAAYRPLLRSGGVVLSAGHTTDSLRSLGADGDDVDPLVARIAGWMEAGEAGPFLHFERSHDALRAESPPR